MQYIPYVEKFLWGKYISVCIAITDYKRKELANKKLAKGILLAKFTNFSYSKIFPDTVKAIRNK